VTKHRAAAALLLALAASAGVPWARQSPVDIRTIARVEPTMVVPRLVYEPKEGIAVQLSLSNPSHVPVDVPAACLSGEAVKIESVTESRMVKGSAKLGDGAALTIPGTGSVKYDILLTSAFKLKRPGHYRVYWECGAWTTPHYDFYVGQAYDPAKDRVAIITTNLGTMQLILMPEQAPVHVRNFVQLARAGYYDDTSFYRVLPGVEADTGDRTGTGEGGWAQQLSPEIDESIRPGKGLVGATRRGGDSTLTSATMFFILLDAQPAYKGKHTFFAYVSDGLDVLDAINDVAISGDSGRGGFRPLTPVMIRKIEIRAP